MSEETLLSDVPVATSTGESKALEPRVYEVGYLLVPFIPEEELDKAMDGIRTVLTSAGGLPITEERAHLISLMYPMSKVLENKRQEFEKGYFGWIKFDVSPDKLESIEKSLKANNAIIRYLLVKTARENTLSGKKFNVRPTRSRKTTAPAKVSGAKEEIPTAPIDEKELDKQIEGLVTEE